MANTNKVTEQVHLASIAASLFRKGHKELAADVVVTAFCDGQHVLFDDKDQDSIFMRTLHELLDELGFENILKLSKERAEKTAVLPPTFSTNYPGNTMAIKPWG